MIPYWLGLRLTGWIVKNTAPEPPHRIVSIDIRRAMDHQQLRARKMPVVAKLAMLALVIIILVELRWMGGGG